MLLWFHYSGGFDFPLLVNRTALSTSPSATAASASLARRLGRRWRRVKGGHDEFTYPRQTPLPSGERKRKLGMLAKALEVPARELLE